MTEKELIDYFEHIEPSHELIERTIHMSKENNKKRVRLSKKIIAVIAAAVVLAIGITGYAGISRIIGDNKGIVSEQSNNDALVFNFSKASRTPEKYSDKKEAIVSQLNKLKHNNVLLPTALFDDSYKIYNVINPFLRENSSRIEIKNDKYDVTITLIGDLAPEEMDGFMGTGDERTICNVTNVNGVDVCICIEGEKDFGYSPYIFYAVDDTMYWINFCAGTDYEEAVETAKEFVATLKQ